MGKQTARANLTIPGAIAMILAAAGASAQQTPPAEKPVLGEIIVTAQKRAESVRDVPSAVSVVSQSQLENCHVTQLSDIAALRAGSAGHFEWLGRAADDFAARHRPDLSGRRRSTYVDETPLGSSGNLPARDPVPARSPALRRGADRSAARSARHALRGGLDGRPQVRDQRRHRRFDAGPDGLRIPRRRGHVRCRRGGRFRKRSCASAPTCRSWRAALPCARATP